MKKKKELPPRPAAEQGPLLSPALLPHLGALDDVAVRVPVKHRLPPRGRERERNPGSLQPLDQRVDRPHAHAEVPVSTSVRRPPFRRVRARELHQVDHLVVLGPADPQPGAAVGELRVGPVAVHREAEHALVEFQRFLQIRDQEADVVDGLEEGLLLRGAAARACCSCCYGDGGGGWGEGVEIESERERLKKSKRQRGPAFALSSSCEVFFSTHVFFCYLDFFSLSVSTVQ